MGLLDKVESTITLGILAVAGYVFIVNYQTIKELWCKIPGMCIDRGEILECKLTANDCWNQNGPYSQVDLTNCSCTPSVTPPKTCNPTYIQLANCKLSGHDWNYNPEVCACNDYVPPTCQEVCEEFGKDCVNGKCVEQDTSSEAQDLESCLVAGGTWNSFTGECDQRTGECFQEIPPGSGCYPYAEGSHCNTNCNVRCADSAGNYRPCKPDDGTFNHELWTPIYPVACYHDSCSHASNGAPCTTSDMDRCKADPGQCWDLLIYHNLDPACEPTSWYFSGGN